MEVNNLVVSTATTEVEVEEEEEEEEEEEDCVTPRDSGNRIPTPTVCPPAPRKKPRAVFDVKRHKRTESKEEEEEEKEFRFEEDALELIFALRTAKKTKITKNGKDQKGSSFCFSDSENFSH